MDNRVYKTGYLLGVGKLSSALGFRGCNYNFRYYTNYFSRYSKGIKSQVIDYNLQVI